jgi:cytidylate kinase
MTLWDIKRRVHDLYRRPGRCFEDGVAYGPCLLVSRQCGGGGSVIARAVAQRLGWNVFDREILDEITRLAKIRTQVLETVDRETRAKWEADWEAEMKPEHLGYERYLRYLRQVVLALGHHGDVVILGRGALFLLPAASALRVRVVAPIELRVQSLVQRTGKPEPEVREHIEKADAERIFFTQTCFQRDPDSALNYDLVLNTGAIGVESAGEIILRAMKDKLGLELSK